MKTKRTPTWRSPIIKWSSQIPKVGDVIRLSSRRMDGQGKEEEGREGRRRSKCANKCREAREFLPVFLSIHLRVLEIRGVGGIQVGEG